MKIAVIFGGSGFVGVSLVRKLLDQGFRIRVVTRDKEKAAFLKTFAAPDFLSLIEWNYHSLEHLDGILTNADLVVNLVGILHENRKGDFKRTHTDLAKNIAHKCQQLHVKNLVYVSALAAEKPSKSKYAASKLEAEIAIQDHFSGATILRPSIIFGERDNFFNKFAALSKPFKILPLINHGKTKFQPIYVEDLAQIIAQIPQNKKFKDKIYEVGGDKVYNFKTLMELIGSYCGREIKFINLSFFAAKTLACLVEGFSKKILTVDQVEMLKSDSILREDNFKKDFAINPKSVEEIVPNYLH